MPSVVAAPRRAFRQGACDDGERGLPEEAAVALVHDATTSAVMMATPADLEDFGLGFSLTEGIVNRPDEITALEVVAGEAGVEVRMWLAPERAAEAAARRRRIVGPTGCGLCGVDSLAEASRSPRKVAPGGRIAPAEVQRAIAAFATAQPLGAATRAVHAAGFWTADEGLIAVREDVGRHNALDKLAGALARAGRDVRGGAVLLTSRVSVEMVQKSAAIGAPIVIAVSAPTALAVRTAREAGMTLIAVARSDGFEVFTDFGRIDGTDGFRR